jgi:hypothetical protein
MCHLRSRGRVANLKNKFAKMGVQDLNFGFVQHVAHALLWSSGGRGDVNILEEYYTWPMELLAVVNMLHMFAYGHQVGAYSWTWRHNVALIRLVGVCGHGVAERQIPQIPAFCLLASKISISNLSPLQVALLFFSFLASET